MEQFKCHIPKLKILQSEIKRLKMKEIPREILTGQYLISEGNYSI